MPFDVTATWEPLWRSKGRYERAGRTTMTADYDVILVGGGLQSGLIALALLRYTPHLRLAIVESSGRLGGNHTWSFHVGDVPEPSWAWIEPLISARWPDYDVLFPGFQRTVPLGYASILSDQFDTVVQSTLKEVSGECVLGETAVEVAVDRVALQSGRMLSGNIVVDARGPSSTTTHAGYQKFLGIEIEANGASWARPILMDATVPQEDGYRFLYVLPFSNTRCLIEDTYFSDSPDLDSELLRTRIHAYLDQAGISIHRVIREEQGVLPMPWRSGLNLDSQVLSAGYRGGWFHPATGYSFPIAVRWAETFATSLREGKGVLTSIQKLRREQDRQASFAYLLNSLLFKGFAPRDRWNVFARFYRLPVETISRFYSLSMTIEDRRRLILGWPPRGLSPRRWIRRHWGEASA